MNKKDVERLIIKQMNQYESILNSAFKNQDAYSIDLFRIRLDTLQILWDEIKRKESK